MQNFRRLALPLFSIVFVITVALIMSTYLLNPLNPSFDTHAQNSTDNRKMIGSHTPGYPVFRSTGDILDPISIPGNSKNAVVDPNQYLREFNYGHVSKYPNGTTLREYTLIASDSEIKEVSPGVFYNVWTYNGTIPGPTIRATEGDHLKINFINNGSKPHSVHTHGIHPAEMDGVFDMIGPKGKFTYEFTAEPFGVYPYHCHMTPLEEHITHGLYGVMIIDPKTPRPQADEMVMVMNGYDTDFDTENNFYTVNGIPYFYMHSPIEIKKDELTRIYLVNMLEFDPINNFHLHANMFNYYPSGTSQTPTELNDILTMSQGERGILEFKYKYPGNYMFHAHKTEFAEKGWMGMFKVIDNSQDDKNDADLMSNSAENPNNASNPNNQSYLVVDSSQNGVKNMDLENNNMVYNYTSYELDKNSLHNNQQHTNNPNDVISSYQYGANSSQAKPRSN
jgi:manganese oxidase